MSRRETVMIGCYDGVEAVPISRITTVKALPATRPTDIQLQKSGCYHREQGPQSPPTYSVIILAHIRSTYLLSPMASAIAAIVLSPVSYIQSSEIALFAWGTTSVTNLCVWLTASGVGGQKTNESRPRSR